MTNEKKTKDTNNDCVEFTCKPSSTGLPPKLEEELKSFCIASVKLYLKHIWHDASEEPQRGKDIIAISKKEEVYAFHYHALSAIRKSLHDCNIERWCYLSDILPKEGGEK